MKSKKHSLVQARYKRSFFYILSRAPCFRCAACLSGYRFPCLHPVVLVSVFGESRLDIVMICRFSAVRS